LLEPPRWTKEQLEADRVKAIAIFRKLRLEEPLEDYLEAFDEYQGFIEVLLETTVDLSALEASALEVLTDPRLLEVFRYLAAPPISRDDLLVAGRSLIFGKGTVAVEPTGYSAAPRSGARGSRPSSLRLGSGEP
jgi:hypothetical protein